MSLSTPTLGLAPGSRALPAAAGVEALDPCPPYLFPRSGLGQPQRGCKGTWCSRHPEPSSPATPEVLGAGPCCCPHPRPSLTSLWASQASSSWEFRAWVSLAMATSLSWASCSFWSSSSCHPWALHSSCSCARSPARASTSSWGPGGGGEGKAWSQGTDLLSIELWVTHPPHQALPGGAGLSPAAGHCPGLSYQLGARPPCCPSASLPGIVTETRTH